MSYYTAAVSDPDLVLTISRDALAKYSAADFAAAGYAPWVRGRFSQIATHENEHATLLSGALGNMTVAPCTYKL